MPKYDTEKRARLKAFEDKLRTEHQTRRNRAKRVASQRKHRAEERRREVLKTMQLDIRQRIEARQAQEAAEDSRKNEGCGFARFRAQRKKQPKPRPLELTEDDLPLERAAYASERFKGLGERVRQDAERRAIAQHQVQIDRERESVQRRRRVLEAMRVEARRRIADRQEAEAEAEALLQHGDPFANYRAQRLKGQRNQSA